jgi:tRNA G18 (ribose-2'-O)-methylase SpoU
VAAKELILCGASETPPLSRIHKAAIGTEEWVKWRYFKTAKEAMLQLRQEIPGTRFIAVEQDTRAMPISELNIIPDDDVPVAIILGHETNGVSKEALDFADIIVEIPMLGINKSLNVHVSAAIAVYKILNIT